MNEAIAPSPAVRNCENRLDMPRRRCFTPIKLIANFQIAVERCRFQDRRDSIDRFSYFDVRSCYSGILRLSIVRF